MKLQQLYSPVRRALTDYNMIEENDRIAIGVSGGKDSLALCYALAGLQKFYPKHFSIVGIAVDLGFGDFDLTEVQKLCDSLSIPLHVEHTQIGPIVFEERKESSPCSLCAKMRKGALNDAALKLGCNKIAYAHHMDDIVETMFLSLLYEGRFYAFSPVTHLDKTNLTVIRPLMYLTEADIIGFQHKYQLPVVKNPCPADGITRREYVKELVRKINRDNPGAKKRIFRAIIDGKIEGWPQIAGHSV